MIYEQPFVQKLETLESMVDQLFPQAVQRDMDWRTKKVKDFIDNTPGKVLGSVGDLCEELELPLSVRQARRLFKESTGISINEYARKRRLLFAARQLQDTDEPVKVIATDAGYHTHKAFAKSFHDLFRLSPMEFRRMWHRIQVTA
jgi:transcriptional regulator GlxA family with amidase domain